VYFDFSGYCDIAYGTALLFGIVLPQNFLSPFKTASIIDFWKHWHITLSRFITSYIYIPLIRNTPGGVLFSKAMLVTIVSMGIAGMWHGAGWTFIAYGLAHGALLAINHCWRKTPIAKKIGRQTSFKYFAIFLTYTAVTLTMALFRSPDIDTAITLLKSLLSINNLQFTHHLQQPIISDISRQLHWNLTPMQKILPIMIFMHAWIWVLPNMQQIMAGRHYASCSIQQKPTRILWKPNGIWSIVTAMALTFSLMALYETGVFLYFKF
jgi:D-alanyl-lipoteichoic acid acyltransferase DltB (MBOAT superfamily)